MSRPVALAALLLAASCTRTEPGREAAPATERSERSEAPAEPAPAAPRRVGTVRGVVRLAEGAELPSYTETELGHVVGGERCSGPGPEDAKPVKLGAGRELGGVMVSATGKDVDAFVAQIPPHTPVERRVAIDDCRLKPRLLVAVRGDSLVIQNQTQMAMFPVFGRAAYADSLVFGASRTEEFTRAGISMLSCGVPPYCGRTDLVVVLHPVFATTDEAGRFEMTNVPADQDVTIHAWHPLFREAKAEARVGEGGETTVELVLEPRAAPPAEAPATQKAQKSARGHGARE